MGVKAVTSALQQAYFLRYYVPVSSKFNNFTMRLVFIISVLFTLMSSISALLCYSCEGNGNDVCVSNPTSAKTKECGSNQYCYMTRTQTAGGSLSIKRGCSSSAQSCTTNLCNSGNGSFTMFPMPDMSGFNVNAFDGFKSSNQAVHRNRNANAAPGNTSASFVTAFVAVVAAAFNCMLQQ